MMRAMTKSERCALENVAIQAYVASGRKIVVVPAGRKTVKTFNMSGGVANKGAKSVTLKNSGFYYR